MKRQLAAAYLLLALALALPILLVDVPLGVDDLNHLARIHVRAHIATDPDLARLFELRDTLLPYMGLDWLLTPLAQIVPTLLAGRIFIVLLLWATVATVMLLQRLFTGRLGYEPLLTGLVSYNALLAWGFLNYLLGAVAALLGFAAWHALRNAPWLARLAAFTVIATSLYYVHLLALALYGAILGVYEVFGRPRAWRAPLRDWLVLGLQFAPAAVLWLRLSLVASGADAGVSWALAAKPAVLASPFLFDGAGGGPDIGLVVFAVTVLILLYLTRIRALRWNRALAAPAAVLAIMGLLVPTRAFGVFLVDVRFPCIAACLAIAALGIEPGFARRLRPLATVLAAGFVLQIGAVTTTMRACDRQYAELRAALQSIPRGAILTAVAEKDTPAPGVPCTELRIYEHMPQLVTIDRSGYSPDFFARVTAVMVRGGLPTDTDPIPAQFFTPDMLPAQGHLLWMHLGNHDRPLPPGLTRLHQGSFFDLFAIP